MYAASGKGTFETACSRAADGVVLLRTILNSIPANSSCKANKVVLMIACMAASMYRVKEC